MDNKHSHDFNDSSTSATAEVSEKNRRRYRRGRASPEDPSKKNSPVAAGGGGSEQSCSKKKTQKNKGSSTNTKTTTSPKEQQASKEGRVVEVVAPYSSIADFFRKKESRSEEQGASPPKKEAFKRKRDEKSSPPSTSMVARLSNRLFASTTPSPAADSPVTPASRPKSKRSFAGRRRRPRWCEEEEVFVADGERLVQQKAKEQQQQQSTTTHSLLAATGEEKDVSIPLPQKPKKRGSSGMMVFPRSSGAAQRKKTPPAKKRGSDHDASKPHVVHDKFAKDQKEDEEDASLDDTTASSSRKTKRSFAGRRRRARWCEEEEVFVAEGERNKEAENDADLVGDVEKRQDAMAAVVAANLADSKRTKDDQEGGEDDDDSKFRAAATEEDDDDDDDDSKPAATVVILPKKFTEELDEDDPNDGSKRTTKPTYSRRPLLKSPFPPTPPRSPYSDTSLPSPATKRAADRVKRQAVVDAAIKSEEASPPIKRRKTRSSNSPPSSPLQPSYRSPPRRRQSPRTTHSSAKSPRSSPYFSPTNSRRSLASPEVKELFETKGHESNWHGEVEDAIQAVQEKLQADTRALLVASMKRKNEIMSRPNRMMKSLTYPALKEHKQEQMDSEHMDQPDYPVPRDNFTTIYMKTLFLRIEKEGDGEDQGDDEEDGDDDGEGSGDSKSDDEESMVNTTSLDRKIRKFRVRNKHGAGFEEQEVDDEIDEILKRLDELDHNRAEIHQYLALLLQVYVGRISKRYKLMHKKEQPVKAHPTAYETVTSSFRDLFCRRCCTYDCNIHGIGPQYDPEIQAELVIRRDREGKFWKKDPLVCVPVESDVDDKREREKKQSSNKAEKPKTKDPAILEAIANLTEHEKVMAQKLYHLSDGDLDKVAIATAIPKEVLSELDCLTPFVFKMEDSDVFDVQQFHRMGKLFKKGDAHRMPTRWKENILRKSMKPYFEPCVHAGPCSEENCSCVQNAVFCTKACQWGPFSRNFFEGCKCTGSCTTKGCSCYAANRECDPDLCRSCGTCTDPPNKLARNQCCRNDNITMRRKHHTLLGKSDIAGWGLFNKHPISKGDIVQEYVGEVVDHDEAERRGAIYDREGKSYLFDMGTDVISDSIRMGNKTRYINHSVNNNCEQVSKIVNGDVRIAIFAKQNIPPESELTFNYGEKFIQQNWGAEWKK